MHKPTSIQKFALDYVRKEKLKVEHKDCIVEEWVWIPGMPEWDDALSTFVDTPDEWKMTGSVKHAHNCGLGDPVTENNYREWDSNYCIRHGVYVGDAYGPDYMCGACESGYEPTLYQRALEAAHAHQREQAQKVFDVLRSHFDLALKEMTTLDGNPGEWLNESDIDRIMIMSVALNK